MGDKVSKTVKVTAGFLVAGSGTSKLKYLKFRYADHPTIRISFEVVREDWITKAIFIRLIYLKGGDVNIGMQAIVDYVMKD